MPDTFSQGAFYFFAAMLLFAATMVITVRNPVRAALFLVLAFVSAACVWVLLEAEFLGIVLVLVYVGAVMVLFLFVVMMLDVNLVQLREGFGEYLPIGGLVAALMLVEMIVVLGAGGFDAGGSPAPAPHPEGYSNTRELGALIYTTYVFPFQVAALILLVAIVAAITLTLRRRKGTRQQDPAIQVRANPRERVRLVDMPAEKRR